MASVEGAQRFPGQHWLTRLDQNRHRLVRGSQAGRVLHAHDTAARDEAGERDHTGAGRPYRRTDIARQIHPAVPGQPRSRRR
jgi:hypothetical protein